MKEAKTDKKIIKNICCSVCGNKLTQYELADNIAVGLSDSQYVCYPCQSDEDVDDEYFDEIEY